MIFHSLDIAKLVAFQFADIDRLELNFSNTVHLILGTNGSGKSSLLRELTPLPSPRSAYETGGKKVITLSHRGHVYTLTSDYANKTAPHAFHKDGITLNEGGTTQVQEELIRTELGYTGEIDALVTGAYEFAKMTPSFRRTLLINLNPWQLGFVLDYHKQAGSAIRACKANLAMLQERKLLLEQDFLPEEQQAQLTTEREAIQKEIALVIEFLHRADDRLRQFVPEKSAPFDADWEAYRRIIYQQLHRYGKYREVPRENRAGYEKQLLQTQSAYRERLAVLKEQQQELIELRNADHAILAELDEVEILRQAQLREKTRQAELDALKAKSCRNPASPESLAEWVYLGPELQRQLQTFLDCTIKLRSDAELQKLHQKLQHWQYVFQENSLELSRLVGEVARIEKLQTLKLSDIPDEPCAKHACVLFVQFKTAHDRRLAQLDDLTKRIAYLQRQNTRLADYLNARAASLKHQAQYTPHIQSICTYLDQLGVSEIAHFTRRLQQNPMTIYHQTATWIAASEATYRYRDLLAEQDAEQWKQKAQRQVASEEKERIRQRVVQSDQKYTELTNRILAGETKLTQIDEQLELLEDYHTQLNSLNGQHRQLLDTLQHLWRRHDRQQLQQIIAELSEKRNHAIRRLGEIDHVLQNQQYLQTRYDEEVLKQLAKIEEERKEWLWMEASLAKIPVAYQVTFLNNVIATMNRYIAKVFSYPLALLPVSMETELDYKFPVQVANVLVPDASLCSDAQKEIINFTFRIAVMKQLGLNEYPIQLDEIGRTFDTYHKQRLLELLREILEDHVVSQMHLVNHNALIHEGLTNVDVLVLNDANIMTPPVYNQHVVFNRID